MVNFPITTDCRLDRRTEERDADIALRSDPVAGGNWHCMRLIH
jgi:hypothetical protein